MALLEILHKHSTVKFLNEEYGCDYIFTGKNKAEYWMHVQNCPFQKVEKVVDVAEDSNKVENESCSKCDNGVSETGHLLTDCNLENDKACHWSALKCRQEQTVYRRLQNGEAKNDIENGNNEISRSRTTGEPSEVMRHYDIFAGYSFHGKRDQDLCRSKTPIGHVTPSVRDLFRM
ncbi:uncharacterized protein LOC132735715 isoform X2 [Ruditapes philippinarum]|uniref:uncharacterized protein LOC132735715 isoform X2 n=1 Tax=Ruditapes philippinarum TaxID=129788 RepID=UPI00295B6A76|nr:uncharacterized protein LOC132735715 isoform X2 [Ruditapes philippinarum]